MNIQTNYSTTNASFRGLKLSAKKQTLSKAQNILQQDMKDIVELTQNASSKKMHFFDVITSRYNQYNYFKEGVLKESSDIVNQIFKFVEKPTDLHFEVSRTYRGSMENLLRIFTASENKKEYLNFVCNAQKEIIGEHSRFNENIIPELLESANREEYVKNFKNYTSYLKLNRNDKKAVSKLDNLVDNGLYDSKVYDNSYLFRKRESLFNLPVGTDVFNSKIFATNYTSERASFLKNLTANVYATEKIIKSGADKDILEMFMSTVKNNVNLRINIMQRAFARTSNEEINKNLITNLNQLFKTIDEDKFAKKFISSCVKHGADFSDLENINKILQTIPTLKLMVFRENARKIINHTRVEDRIPTLQKEIENPFYETKTSKSTRKMLEEDGYYKKSTVFSKLFKHIQNQIRKFQYKYLSARFNITKDEPKVTHSKIIADIVESTKSERQKTAIEPLKSNEQGKKTIAKIEKQLSKPTDYKSVAESLIPKFNNQATYNKKAIELNNLFKKVVKADNDLMQKEELKKLTSAKLGSKIFKEQYHDFEVNRTKMRLSILPEIFASIADTRKVDRAVGKLKSNSSNQDALDLYSLINGANKKYINYLLKKRNVDNTRMFEVKDIIEMIRKAETKIATDKKSNPEYKTNDARKYYNKLYEAKIEQYGKVKPQKSTKKK